MKKVSLLLLCLLASIMGAKAQIGYQISLLNTATGEPRANETVTVSVSLSNNANEVFYSETKSATTNDFGVLSLSIGNADTFANIDFTKMPFFIEVSANGVNIGKSQMLSVPVAEYAKRTGQLSPELLIGTWVCESDYNYPSSSSYTFQDDNGNWHSEQYEFMIFVQERNKWIFNADGTCKKITNDKKWTVGVKSGDRTEDNRYESECYYEIDGNTVTLFNDPSDSGGHYNYTYKSPYATRIYETVPYFSTNSVLGKGYTKQ